MTENIRTVERYMDDFRKSNHEQTLSCLADDVEWEMPGRAFFKNSAESTNRRKKKF